MIAIRLLISAASVEADGVTARFVIFLLPSDHHRFPYYPSIARKVCDIRSGSELLLKNSGVSLIDM
jgi:hypothetical protein